MFRVEELSFGSENSAAHNNVDIEFNTIEKEGLSLIDQASLVLELFDELGEYNTPVAHKDRKEGKDSLRTVEADNQTIQRFVLPGNFSVSTNRREGDVLEKWNGESDWRARYQVSESRAFISVPQSECWRIEIDKLPYVRVLMSECSLMVAPFESGLYVAHIGFSSRTQTMAVMDFLKQHNIDQTQMYAVACVGDEFAQRSLHTIEGDSRLYQETQYQELGIPSEHIIPFTYQGEHDGVLKNLSAAVVTRDFLAQAYFDSRRTSGFSEKRSSDYRGVRVMGI